jgi:hypothetical protein
LRTLLSIPHRSLRKATYLKVLEKHYANKKNRSVDQFRDLLSKARQEDAAAIGLHQGVRLEALDPLHRTIELPDTVNGQVGQVDGGGQADLQILQMDGSGNLTGINILEYTDADAYAYAFAEWFNNGIGIPFFLYLENTDVCLADDKVTNEPLKKVIYCNLGDKKAKYKDEDQAKQLRDSKVMVCQVGEFGQIWWGEPWVRVRDFRVCDTSAYDSPGKAGPGYAAYVFSTEYDLFLAKHEAGVWHHSSFTGGNPVRCAGMTKILRGKVVGLTSHSGHYRPGLVQFKNFVDYLSQQGVLDPSQLQMEVVGTDFKGKLTEFYQFCQTEGV